MTSLDSALTPGQIARLLGEPQHRIDHVLNTRRHIRPLRRVGIVRVYSSEALKLVRIELRSIDQRRGRVPAA